MTKRIRSLLPNPSGGKKEDKKISQHGPSLHSLELESDFYVREENKLIPRGSLRISIHQSQNPPVFPPKELEEKKQSGLIEKKDFWIKRGDEVAFYFVFSKEFRPSPLSGPPSMLECIDKSSDPVSIGR
jgi:hypothetical protein